MSDAMSKLKKMVPKKRKRNEAKHSSSDYIQARVSSEVPLHMPMPEANPNLIPSEAPQVPQSRLSGSNAEEPVQKKDLEKSPQTEGGVFLWASAFEENTGILF